jgi:hypothetical protein
MHQGVPIGRRTKGPWEAPYDRTRSTVATATHRQGFGTPHRTQNAWDVDHAEPYGSGAVDQATLAEGVIELSRHLHRQGGGGNAPPHAPQGPDSLGLYRFSAVRSKSMRSSTGNPSR